MSDRCLEVRRDSGGIPSGRQLPRTPPLPEVKRHLDFCSDLEEAWEAASTPLTSEPGDATVRGRPLHLQEGSGGPDEPDLDATFDLPSLEPKTGHAMLKGMKGYQLTPSDLEFIRTMQEDKLIRKLQGDLEEVNNLLKVEMAAAAKSIDLRERAQAELDKLPSCAELAVWAAAVLSKTSPPGDLDAKCLLSMVRKEDVQRTVAEKETKLAWLEEMVGEKKKKEAEERERMEREVLEAQLKVRGLMRELSCLKSELAQEEEVQRTLQSQVKIKETAEIKAEEEKAEILERREVKGQAKRGNSAAESRGGAERNRTLRGRAAANEDATELPKTKPKSARATRESPAGKPHGEPPPENHGAKQTERGRGKPPPGAPKLRKQVRNVAGSSASRGQATAEGVPNTANGVPDTAAAVPDTAVRRSKRIANRK